MSSAASSTMSSSGGGAGSGPAAVGYFVDPKKGEVNELKQLLRNLNVEKDIRRKREVVKKVIAYMTLGIDVSRLFTDMILAIETRDVVMKKMIYLYLSNYARTEPEMAIMCINSLRRDCDNEDPLVRGLALRSLCSLRLESILEYVEQPLNKAFGDISAYVRKTAVMQVVKLFYLSPSLVETNGYIDRLYGMLNDPDANVVVNAVFAIHELKISSGGLEVTAAIVMPLLNRIGEFSEWGLNTILELVSRYKPANEDEAFAIMNLLDPVLRTANSGSVLATLKCFYTLTSSMPDMHRQITLRSKPPLLTLVAGANPESQYVTLKHLQLILQQPMVKGVFDDEYRQLFVRYNEPPHVKHLKVDVLPLVACVANAREIAAELAEYVTDVDSELAKRAIRAMGEIVSRVPSVATDLTNTLLSFMEVDSPYVRSQTAIVLCDVVRIHPTMSDLVLQHLHKYLKKVEDVEARAALVWMLGEFGANILESPYIIEQIVDSSYEEESVAIKLQVLTAAMKLFFQRPPEVHLLLGRLLKMALNDNTDQDLHDRALLYHRLLSSGDLNAAKDMFATSAACTVITAIGEGGGFAEQKDMEMKKRIFAEFNTLAVVFDLPSVQFIAEKYQLQQQEVPLSDFDFPAATLGAVAPAAASTPAPVNPSANLLDWEDETPAAAPAAVPAPQMTFASIPPDSFTPAAFQEKWTSWPDEINTVVCKFGNVPSDEELLPILQRANLYFIATGPLQGPTGANVGVKVFLYGSEVGSLLAEGIFFVALLSINRETREGHLVLKSSAPNTRTDAILTTLISHLAPFQPLPPV